MNNFEWKKTIFESADKSRSIALVEEVTTKVIYILKRISIKENGKMIIREAKILVKMRHPHIIEVREIFFDENSAYFVFDKFQ